MHRYDATSFEHVDPLLGGDEALSSLLAAAHARGIRVIGDLTHEPRRHRARLVRGRAEPPTSSTSTVDDYAAWMGVRTLPKLNWGSAELRAEMVRVVRKWLDFGLDGWRIDVANMTGRHGDIDVAHAAARERSRGGGRRASSSPSTVTTSAATSPATAGTAR